MQPPTQDFATTQDYTVLNPVSGAELNLGFSQLAPNTGIGITDGSVGVCGVIFTVDSALNTPQVPDASVTTKWQGYLWVRVPFSTAPVTTPIGYFWNNAAPNDATFKKWLSTQVDLTAVNAAITALQTAVTVAQTTATAANATANVALTNSAAAQTTATAANGTANAASAAASTASTAAAAAQSTANTANATATAANATSAAALAAVTAIQNASVTIGPLAINAAGVGGAVINQPHNLGAMPAFIRGVLVCQSAELGYSIADEVDLFGVGASGGGGAYAQPVFVAGATASNVFAIQALTVTNIEMNNKNTGALALITPANWKIKIYARL